MLLVLVHYLIILLVYQIGIGSKSLYDNTEGKSNIGIGDMALEKNTTGKGNCGIGHENMKNNTTGQFNTSLGYSSMTVLQSGKNNICIGYDSNINGEASENEIVIGSSTTGHGNNIAVIGNSYCTAWHPQSDNKVDLGSSIYKFKDLHMQGDIHCTSINTIHSNNNTLIGNNAGISNSTGSYNTCIGHNSLYRSTNCKYNTSIGAFSNRYSDSSNNNNVAIGYAALMGSDGNTKGCTNNTCIGVNSVKY